VPAEERYRLVAVSKTTSPVGEVAPSDTASFKVLMSVTTPDGERVQAWGG
jgi:hypothetical protein